MINAVLLKEVAVLVREVSASGCLLESRMPLAPGAIGTLDVDLLGERRVEWLRIARVARVDWSGEAHLLGAEFLALAVPGRTSVRGVIARLEPFKRGRGMPRLAGRSSGDPGKSLRARAGSEGTTARGPAALAQESADLSQRVVEFVPRDARTTDGSVVAQPVDTDAPGLRGSGKGEVHMKSLFARLVRDDQGQDLIEYVLIGTLVSIAVIIGAGLLGTNLNTWYTNIAGWVATQAANPNL